jgi:glycosyltransferase involved in cell wall biosynthesis
LNTDGLRVAIVHERFTEVGGSERVVEQIYSVWPTATVHAAVSDPDALPRALAGANVHTSPLQRLYRGGRSYAALLPLLPLAMRQLDVGSPDVVIVSHHAFAGRIRPPAGVPVVAYVHTPARWMWEPAMLANEAGGPVGRAALRAFAASQRRADRAAAQRWSRIAVNSRHVADRVRRSWGREAEVIHPPIDTDFFTPDPLVRREDFFLLAGRLVPYKRPEIAAAAARKAGVRLVVVGEGRARPAVEAAAGANVELLGEVDDVTFRDLLRRCQALVFPGEEDFGMVPVEAQACGTPVLARRIGGVLDSVVDGRTGALYDGGADALAEGMRRFDPAAYATAEIRRHAERFGVASFRAAIAVFVESAGRDRSPGI